MNISFESRLLLRQAGGLAALFLILCMIVIYQFTHRSSLEGERERAQVMLRRIYDLEMAHRSENGTYLSINRETNGDILRLNDGVGQFTYRVDVTGDRFVATAKADLDGDGQVEVWQIDQRNTDPVKVNED
jgi:hypothetical protein